MANNVYTYSIPSGKNIYDAMEAVKTCFFLENMETQYLQNEKCHILQARAKSGKIKQFVGLDKAIEVRMTPYNNNSMVTVEIGGAKWVDKAAALAVSMVVLWPLAVTSGIGLYGQTQVLRKVKGVLDKYFYG